MNLLTYVRGLGFVVVVAGCGQGAGGEDTTSAGSTGSTTAEPVVTDSTAVTGDSGQPDGTTGAGATSGGSTGSSTGPDIVGSSTGDDTTTTGEPASTGTTTGSTSDGSSSDTGGPEFTDCADLKAAYAAEELNIRSCEADAQCGQVLKGTSCGCTNDIVARKDADTTHFFELRALGMEHPECELFPPSNCGCRNTNTFECRDDGICDWDFPF